ncbi:MAG: nucleotidyltransferase domain-containing protein [Spiroplasmataceae bacterium]|jgi:predicted nucleotidyltransferase|nr:nucleotidyltransferase domain-containing protein [Spiroplasmataceae bacterium]
MNNNQIQLETRHLDIVKDILAKYPYQFYAYGSRTKGVAKPYSDLDLCYFADIPKKDIMVIKDEFSESRLPIFVELVNWNKMRSGFQENIEKDLLLISND